MPRGTQLSTQREELKEEKKTSHQDRIAFVTPFSGEPVPRKSATDALALTVHNRLYTCLRTLTRFENILPLSCLLHSSDTTKRRLATQDQLAAQGTNSFSQVGLTLGLKCTAKGLKPSNQPPNCRTALSRPKPGRLSSHNTGQREHIRNMRTPSSL